MNDSKIEVGKLKFDNIYSQQLYDYLINSEAKSKFVNLNQTADLCNRIIKIIETPNPKYMASLFEVCSKWTYIYDLSKLPDEWLSLEGIHKLNQISPKYFEGRGLKLLKAIQGRIGNLDAAFFNELNKCDHERLLGLFDGNGLTMENMRKYLPYRNDEIAIKRQTESHLTTEPLTDFTHQLCEGETGVNFSKFIDYAEGSILTLVDGQGPLTLDDIQKHFCLLKGKHIFTPEDIAYGAEHPIFKVCKEEDFTEFNEGNINIDAINKHFGLQSANVSITEDDLLINFFWSLLDQKLFGTPALLCEIDYRYIQNPTMFSYLRRVCQDVPMTRQHMEALNQAADSLFKRLTSYPNISEILKDLLDKNFDTNIYFEALALLCEIDLLYLQNSAMFSYLKRVCQDVPVNRQLIEGLNAAAALLFEKVTNHDNMAETINSMPDKYFDTKIFTPQKFSAIHEIWLINEFFKRLMIGQPQIVDPIRLERGTFMQENEIVDQNVFEAVLSAAAEKNDTEKNSIMAFFDGKPERLIITLNNYLDTPLYFDSKIMPNIDKFGIIQLFEEKNDTVIDNNIKEEFVKKFYIFLLLKKTSEKNKDTNVLAEGGSAPIFPKEIFDFLQMNVKKQFLRGGYSLNTSLMAMANSGVTDFRTKLKSFENNNLEKLGNGSFKQKSSLIYSFFNQKFSQEALDAYKVLENGMIENDILSTLEHLITFTKDTNMKSLNALGYNSDTENTSEFGRLIAGFLSWSGAYMSSFTQIYNKGLADENFLKVALLDDYFFNRLDVNQFLVIASKYNQTLFSVLDSYRPDYLKANKKFLEELRRPVDNKRDNRPQKPKSYRLIPHQIDDTASLLPQNGTHKSNFAKHFAKKKAAQGLEFYKRNSTEVEYQALSCDIYVGLEYLKKCYKENKTKHDSTNLEELVVTNPSKKNPPIIFLPVLEFTADSMDLIDQIYSHEENLQKIFFGVFNVNRNHYLTVFCYKHSNENNIQMIVIDPSFPTFGEKKKEFQIKTIVSQVLSNEKPWQVETPMITQQFNERDCAFACLKNGEDLVLKNLISIDNGKMVLERDQLSLNGEKFSGRASEFDQLLVVNRENFERQFETYKAYVPFSIKKGKETSIDFTPSYNFRINKKIQPKIDNLFKALSEFCAQILENEEFLSQFFSNIFKLEQDEKFNGSKILSNLDQFSKEFLTNEKVASKIEDLIRQSKDITTDINKEIISEEVYPNENEIIQKILGVLYNEFREEIYKMFMKEFINFLAANQKITANQKIVAPDNFEDSYNEFLLDAGKHYQEPVNFIKERRLDVDPQKTLKEKVEFAIEERNKKLEGGSKHRNLILRKPKQSNFTQSTSRHFKTDSHQQPDFAKVMPEVKSNFHGNVEFILKQLGEIEVQLKNYTPPPKATALLFWVNSRREEEIQFVQKIKDKCVKWKKWFGDEQTEEDIDKQIYYIGQLLYVDIKTRFENDYNWYENSYPKLIINQLARIVGVSAKDIETAQKGTQVPIPYSEETLSGNAFLMDRILSKLHIFREDKKVNHKNPVDLTEIPHLENKKN